MFSFRWKGDQAEGDVTEPTVGTDEEVSQRAHRGEEEEEEGGHVSSEALDSTEGGAAADAFLLATREDTATPRGAHEFLSYPNGEEEEETEEAAETAVTSAPAPLAALPTLAMPQAPNVRADRHPLTGRSDAVLRGSAAFNPRGTAVSPRAASSGVLSRGRSRSLGGFSGGAVGDTLEHRYQRCTSAVRSARSVSARRASTVNGVIGFLDGNDRASWRRGSAMTESERFALQRMMENEYRRQEAAERAQQYALTREATIVELELERKKSAQERQKRLERETRERCEANRRIHEEHTAAAAQRREELEKERLRAIYDSVRQKDTRYRIHDPYAILVAKQRYSAELRNSPAIAPHRRTASPSTDIAHEHRSNNTQPTSNGAGVDPRTASAAPSAQRDRRSSTPRVDTSRPRQCLPLDAWKLQGEEGKDSGHAGNGLTPRRGISPRAWRSSAAVIEPIRPWH